MGMYIKKIFMEKIILIIFTFLIISLITHMVFAQTGLKPGTGKFFMQPVGFDDVPLEKNCYGGDPSIPSSIINFPNQKLGLCGDLNYLNVRWKARSPLGLEREIVAKCFLNCFDTGTKEENIDIKCASSQLWSCSYKGPTGDHSCSIQAPNYKFKQLNNVVCKFYDQAMPTLFVYPYPNRTFFPTNFSISVNPVTITVGTPINLPINIKTLGLLVSSFSVNISDLSNENHVIIDNPLITAAELGYGDIGRVFPTINFLVAEKITFNILSRSKVDNTVCNTDNDCTYLDTPLYKAKCISKTCWKSFELEINAGKMSLSEFDIFGFVLIFTLSTILFYTKF